MAAAANAAAAVTLCGLTLILLYWTGRQVRAAVDTFAEQQRLTREQQKGTAKELQVAYERLEEARLASTAERLEARAAINESIKARYDQLAPRVVMKVVGVGSERKRKGVVLGKDEELFIGPEDNIDEYEISYNTELHFHNYGKTPALVQVWEPGDGKLDIDESSFFLEPGEGRTVHWTVVSEGRFIRSLATQAGWHNTDGCDGWVRRWFVQVSDPHHTICDTLTLNQSLYGPQLEGRHISVPYYPFTGSNKIADVDRSYVRLGPDAADHPFPPATPTATNDRSNDDEI